MFKNNYRIVLLFAFIIIGVKGQDKPCLQRKYNHSSYVCVCNANYCDEVSQVVPLESGNYVLYTSSLDGQRFNKTTGIPDVQQTSRTDDLWTWFWKIFNFDDRTSIQINRNRTYQSIKGFGGSFTDSAGINVNSLSAAAQTNLINTYFGPKGIEYNVGRVPIAGTDFSTHPYAYNMEPANDVTLSNFSLSEEDYVYKIPLIQRALQVVTAELLLVGTAWSPPIWMKNNGAYGGASLLLPQFYQTWADYHLKFLQQYNKSGIQFWAITTGNEPTYSFIVFNSFNTLGWLPPDQATWIANNLGPTIKNSSFSNVNILALDDQRFDLPWWIQWDLNHWSTGWIDWNLALDKQGGPNWFNNFVDSAIIVMPDADEFLKQPLFYAVGHFSKFIPRGSVRVDVQSSGSMNCVAFLRPDNGITVVFYNQHDSIRYFTINENGKGSITINVPARSFQTLIYW